jgi:hypothetical protein
MTIGVSEAPPLDKSANSFWEASAGLWTADTTGKRPDQGQLWVIFARNAAPRRTVGLPPTAESVRLAAGRRQARPGGGRKPAASSGGGPARPGAAIGWGTAPIGADGPCFYSGRFALATGPRGRWVRVSPLANRSPGQGQRPHPSHLCTSGQACGIGGAVRSDCTSLVHVGCERQSTTGRAPPHDAPVQQVCESHLTIGRASFGDRSTAITARKGPRNTRPVPSPSIHT